MLKSMRFLQKKHSSILTIIDTERRRNFDQILVLVYLRLFLNTILKYRICAINTALILLEDKIQQG